jgi:hypothetical protein
MLQTINSNRLIPEALRQMGLVLVSTDQMKITPSAHSGLEAGPPADRSGVGVGEHRF